MAQPREKGGRVVFIGNIPYGVTEEEITHIFGSIGQVVSFRLVYDKETQKPKGFGFLEYPDVDQAAAAVRNLNGHEIRGRQLKVDYSNDNGGGAGNRQDRADQQAHRAPPPPHFEPNANGSLPNGAAQPLPPLPPGADPQPGVTAPDAISKTLNAVPPAQLLDMLSQMKSLVATDPQRAQQLLATAPQLGYAIFQALLLLGLVDRNVVGQLIQQPAPAQPPQAMPSIPYHQPPPPQPMQPYGVYSPQAQPPYAQYSGYVSTPPQHQPAYQPPPQAPPVQPPVQSQVPLDPQRQLLIDQVLAMTPEQIYAQPDGPRNQLIALRAQLGKPVA